MNVSRLIDDGPLTRFQIVTIICCALVSALDGMDTQSIGVAAPFIAEEFGVKLAHFGPIFSSALVGATVGAASFGPLADRFKHTTGHEASPFRLGFLYIALVQPGDATYQRIVDVTTAQSPGQQPPITV